MRRKPSMVGFRGAADDAGKLVEEWLVGPVERFSMNSSEMEDDRKEWAYSELMNFLWSSMSSQSTNHLNMRGSSTCLPQ